jgi:hypothetical protein
VDDRRPKGTRPGLAQTRGSADDSAAFGWSLFAPSTIRTVPAGGFPLEFLNFVLMFVAAWLVFRKPEKERLAFRLLAASVVLMVILFSIATRTSLLPGVNY